MAMVKVQGEEGARVTRKRTWDKSLNKILLVLDSSAWRRVVVSKKYVEELIFGGLTLATGSNLFWAGNWKKKIQRDCIFFSLMEASIGSPTRKASLQHTRCVRRQHHLPRPLPTTSPTTELVVQTKPYTSPLFCLLFFLLFYPNQSMFWIFFIIACFQPPLQYTARTCACTWKSLVPRCSSPPSRKCPRNC